MSEKQYFHHPCSFLILLHISNVLGVCRGMHVQSHASYAEACAPSCNLELSDKLQKQICKTVGPSLAASLEPLTHH